MTNPAAGFSLAFNKYGTVAATPYVPTDQRLEGPHGLTFRTPELTRPLSLAGPIGLHLVAASTAADTDWYAKLSHVAPDGSESIIEEGALRASHRALDPAQSTPERPYHTHTDPQPIEPNRFYEYDIEIWPTAYRLAPGTGCSCGSPRRTFRPTPPARSTSTAPVHRTRASTCSRQRRTRFGTRVVT